MRQIPAQRVRRYQPAQPAPAARGADGGAAVDSGAAPVPGEVLAAGVDDDLLGDEPAPAPAPKRTGKGKGKK